MPRNRGGGASAPGCAGLRQGDVVTALNGQPITTSRALVRGVAGLPPGETVRLTLTRGGRQQDIAVQIGRRPNDNQG